MRHVYAILSTFFIVLVGITAQNQQNFSNTIGFSTAAITTALLSIGEAVAARQEKGDRHE